MNDLSKYLIRKSSSYIRLCVGAFWISTFLPIFYPQFCIFSPLKNVSLPRFQLSLLYGIFQAMALPLISLQIYRSKCPQETSTCVEYYQNMFQFSIPNHLLLLISPFLLMVPIYFISYCSFFLS